MFKKTGETNQSDITPDIHSIRNELLNKGLIYFAIIIPFALVVSLMRIPEFGWNPVYIIHILITTFTVLSAIFRNSLIYKLKAFFLLGIFLVLGVAGLLSFGLVGGGMVILVIFTILVAIAFGTRAGLIACILDFMILSITGYFVWSGYIRFSFDIEEYALSFTAWIILGVIFFMFVPVLVISLGIIHKSLVSSLLESQERQAENKRLQNYLTNIIDSMPSMIVGVNDGGNITQWNKEAENLTGFQSDQVAGKYLGEIIPRFNSDMIQILKTIETKEITSITREIRILNGKRFYEDITAYPLKDNKNKGVVIRIDDVTEKVRVEEMMVQSEKMDSIGVLAKGMAHKVNNPLAGMLQTADVVANRLIKKIDVPANRKAAEEAGTSTEAIKSFMEKRGIPRMIESIKDSGVLIADIVTNILNFSQKSEAVFSSHNMVELMDKTLELVSSEYDLKKQYDFNKIDIVKEYEKNLPYILCEASKIQQVLLNLLRNGSQAMQDTGTENPRFTLRINSDTENRKVSIEIEDNGPGMTEEIQKRIFEPFFTTKPEEEGTGLGLSVSYFIISENHNGEMSVESTPGKGTKFIISLPIEHSYSESPG